MNVLFLDYDGVVNTAMWDESGTHCRYNFPKDGRVNNFQAVQWVSEFCERAGYSIVVTSSWRLDSNYKECLINGGLRSGIEILGRTDDLYKSHNSWFNSITRGEEIAKYLSEHPEVENYIIVDDEDDFSDEQKSHFIQINSSVGFSFCDMSKCLRLHQEQISRKLAGTQ